MSSTIAELISKFPEKRILVIGDVIIDQYIYGTATGLSAETPTVVAKELNTVTTLGGAFLLVRNLLELGAYVTFLSVKGTDGIISTIGMEKLECHLLVDMKNRTTSKKRYWIDNYKLLQMDVLESPNTIGQEPEFGELLHKNIAYRKQDKVVVSDYRHGLLTNDLIDYILKECRREEKPVYVDSQISRKLYSESNYEQYKGADVFCMNLREAQFTDPEFTAASCGFSRLCEILGSENIVVKLGADGCVSVVRGVRLDASPGFKVNTVDTCGAGDAFLAALCLCDLENSPAESLRIANAWAALSTTIHGTEPPKKEQLIKLLEATR